MNNENRTKTPIWLITAVVLGLLLLLGIIFDVKEVYSNYRDYNKAIELIEQGEYTKAGTILWDFNINDYKDGRYLYSYAYYMKYKDNDAYNAYRCLKEIPENYSGKFAEEIANERPLCEAAYAEYKREQARLDAERKKEVPNNQPAVTTAPAVTTKPRVVTTKKKKVYPDDEFDVYDYYDVEDFYDDHEDDFWDFEDAEDYFDEAWDNVD
ncbi:MAG: hypothetical protein NC120_06920 [Ruminococcus sp.]|nr:hypothetical protein [Ruminococcus sp.]